MGIIEPRHRGRPKNKIPRKPDRKLYKIDQVIRTLGITGRTIRYYDQMGLLPHVKRSDGGIRLFDDQDVELIKKIRKLQKESHLSLGKIREVIFKTSSETEDSTRWVVLTDSMAAIPAELRESLPIEIIPFSITIKKDVFIETQTTPSKLWERATELVEHPVLVPPSEADFIAYYKSLAHQGYARVYSIHCSSEISLAYQNALSASHKVTEVEVVVVDSRSSGPGLGLLVRLISKAISDGESALEISMLLEKQVHLAYNLMMVDGFRFLTTGDHLASGPHSLLAKILGFKPVLSMKSPSGNFEIVECSKDKLTAMRLMVETLESEIKARGGYVSAVMVTYNYLYGESVEMVNEIKGRYHNAEVFITEGSTTFSAIMGPGSLNIGII